MTLSNESLSFVKEQQQRAPEGTPLRQKFDRLLQEVEPTKKEESKDGKQTATAKK